MKEDCMASRTRSTVHTETAPAAIGPYSQAVQCGDLVFCSGQIALDPKTGELASGDAAMQTRQALQNLEAVLQAAGSSLAQVVKTTIFLVDLADFGKVNQVYGEFFAAAPPARSTVQVAALPRGAQVEIEAVAVR
jgi:2-iminobutanoate/2-iminopropanoate deaminase